MPNPFLDYLGRLAGEGWYAGTPETLLAETQSRARAREREEVEALERMVTPERLRRQGVPPEISRKDLSTWAQIAERQREQTEYQTAHTQMRETIKALGGDWKAWSQLPPEMAVKTYMDTLQKLLLQKPTVTFGKPGEIPFVEGRQQEPLPQPGTPVTPEGFRSMQEEAAGRGVALKPSYSELGQIKGWTEEPQRAGGFLDELAQSASTYLGADQDYPSFAALPSALKKLALDENMKMVAATQGLILTKREEAQARLPIKPEEVALWRDPDTLMEPPAELRRLGKEELLARGYRRVDEKDLDALVGVVGISAQLAVIGTQAKNLFTATTPFDAATQGLRLVGSSVPIPLTDYRIALGQTGQRMNQYLATREAFLGVLARALGGERGVLTQRDIDRIKQSLPSPFDIASVVQFKTKLMDEITEAAIEARTLKMFGRTSPRILMQQIQKKIEDLEGAGTAPPGGTPPKVIKRRELPERK